jgi:cytochrome c biogenesis protein CcmG/thiol:disulfide interchange protein DsbE
MTSFSDETSRRRAGDAAGAASAPAINRRRLLGFVPILATAGLFGTLALNLNRDPSKVPSVLIGKAVPEFNLPPVKGRAHGLSKGDLSGQVSLVNVFASWCVPCRQEHPLFMALSQRGTVPIHGLNYKDQPENAAAWLDDLGDPYARTGADRDGRVAIDWGVYGVPETFVVGRDGVIHYKHIGAMTPEVLETTILPLVASLQQ